MADREVREVPAVPDEWLAEVVEALREASKAVGWIGTAEAAVDAILAAGYSIVPAASAARPKLQPCPSCSEPLSATGAGTIACPSCGWTMDAALAASVPAVGPGEGERAWAALHEWVRKAPHLPGCSFHRGGDCDCGRNAPLIATEAQAVAWTTAPPDALLVEYECPECQWHWPEPLTTPSPDATCDYCGIRLVPVSADPRSAP